MEKNSLYRSLFLMDDTRNYTNDFYISEFAKIVLYKEGCFTLSLADLCDKIVNLTSLEYTEEDIVHALSIWNNGEVDIDNGLYMLSTSGMERISKRKKSNNLKIYIDLFLKENADKYSITKNELEELLEGFIYQRFNENLKEISDILNHCLTVENYDKKYTDNEKSLINDFLAWNNIDKNECIYRLIAKAYDYCMINSKCQAQEMVFSKIHFYLDTNIIFRLMGINGEERESSVKSLIEKCRAAGIKLIVSNFVIEECEYTINSQLELLIESTKMMNKLMPPSTMSFAEEKSIKLDFYRRYYDWVREGNKHRNYDGFKKCVLKEFNVLLSSFDKDDNNTSFKVLYANDFKAFYDSLYSSKMDKHTTETDVNSTMLIWEKRKNTSDENDYFLISADQRLVFWSREIFPGQKSYIDFPSVWLSIILKYIGRERDTDYKAFCQFIHLSIEPQIEDLEKKIAIKSNIITTDIDDEIKTMMIDEVRENYNQYKDYEPEEVVRVAYAKTKETIEKEVELKKETEFEERLDTVKKEFCERLSEQQREIDTVIAENKKATIDAYKQGREDLINEEKEAETTKRITRTLNRNKLLRKIIRGAICIVLIAATVSLFLLLVFGFLKDGSAISNFFNKYGLYTTLMGYILGCSGFVLDIKSVKEKVLPVDKEIIREKITKE